MQDQEWDGEDQNIGRYVCECVDADRDGGGEGGAVLEGCVRPCSDVT